MKVEIDDLIVRIEMSHEQYSHIANKVARGIAGSFAKDETTGEPIIRGRPGEIITAERFVSHFRQVFNLLNLKKRTR